MDFLRGLALRDPEKEKTVLKFRLVDVDNGYTI